MKQIIIIISLFLFLPFNRDFYTRQKNFLSDTTNIQVRKPSDLSLDKFRMDKEFQYGRVENPTGLWQIISVWIIKHLRNLLDSRGFYFVSKYFKYIILIIAVIIVAYILHKSKLRGVIYSSERTPAIKFNELDENIHEIDFDNLINNASKNKQYRVAVRYYYLKTLKLLTDNGIIEWKINKTNYQYLKEIKEKELHLSFSELTNLFEWIWYGDSVIENISFESTKEKFISFYNKLAVKK